jgi:sugar-phosphatase
VDLGKLAGQTFEAVIFDMDGTLIDSTPAVIRAWATWRDEHGLSAEDMAVHHGVPAAATVRAILPEHLHESALDRIHELEVTDVDDIELLPGAAEALAALVHGRSAIATSCTAPLAAARIRAARLVAPSVLVTVDDVEHGKPHPAPFLEAARRLGVDPARSLVVEDAPKGLQAAKAAGCFTLAVTTTTAAEDLDADAVVQDLSAVRFQVVEGGVRVQPAS